MTTLKAAAAVTVMAYLAAGVALYAKSPKERATFAPDGKAGS